MTKKINKIQIFRHLVQIILFFLLPGLYIMAFSELKGVYQMILKGNFNFIQAFPGIFELVTILFITIVLGRFFCGWVCVFGAYNDLIHEISKKVFKIKFKVNENLDIVLKYLKYLILAIIMVFAWTLGGSILGSASPWEAFAQITDISLVLSDFAVGLLLLLLITVGAMFVERFFCRYLCPLGAVFTIISKISIFKIRKPNDKCGKCRICTNNCSMGIPLYNVNSVRGGECINCLKCKEVCPRKNISANIAGADINSGLAGSAAIAAFAGMYALNGSASKVLVNKGLASASSISTSSMQANYSNYKDGTYKGQGTGFRGGTTSVSIVIKSGKIVSIETVSTEDTPDFYQRASGTVINDIVSTQSTSVDTVSGATFSSNGIIEAVNDALNNALASSAASKTESTNTSNTAAASSSDTSANTSSDTENTTSQETGSSSAKETKYKDGTYVGEGSGFRGGTTSVSVTVKSGKITSIKTISTQDTPEFYERSSGTVIDEIISNQSTSVDTVSGATFSSRGIMEAVESALSKAI
ncbi:MAG: FMN-binding protein [Bacillota bacterium]|nr:FMN-binding protein [Bacillota bacterium]